jgi:predicted CoA-binding protein
MGARMVWMQEGVIHRAAAEKARAAGLGVVMDRCILKEHRRHFR